jgi:YD repeat-containing protein
MIDKVFDSAVHVASYTYNEDSTIEAIAYGSGITASYSYDRDRNIISLINKDPQQSIISSYSYAYDNNGNILAENKNGQITTYTYDALSRLKTANYPDRGLETFTYDNAGNRLSRTLGSINETYRYDNRNRLTQRTVDGIICLYTYDNSGNLLSESTAGNVTLYTYDAFNRLTEVTKSDGTWMRNTYDALGMRTSVLENGIWTGFTFDGANVVSETAASNELTARYIRGYSLIALQDASLQTGYYLQKVHKLMEVSIGMSSIRMGGMIMYIQMAPLELVVEEEEDSLQLNHSPDRHQYNQHQIHILAKSLIMKELI